MREIVKSCQPGLWELIQRSRLHLCVAEARATASLMVMWWIDIQERVHFWKLDASGYWSSQAWRSYCSQYKEQHAASWCKDFQSSVLFTCTFLTSDVQIRHLNVPIFCFSWLHPTNIRLKGEYSCSTGPVDVQSTVQNPDNCINKAYNDMCFIITWISSPCIHHHGLPLLCPPTLILLLNIPL